MPADTWVSPEPPPHSSRLTLRDWLRVIRRGVPLGLLVFGGLGLMLLVRLIERPFHGAHRPWTPAITVRVCRLALRWLGLSYHVHGTVLTGAGAFVANHASWLDIFSLNALTRLYFVSKAEVASWPGIGWLAQATGTVFIRRDRRDARAHVAAFQSRLAAGHRLLFFPEGTSTDGQRVLTFKPTLFAAFLAPDLPFDFRIQPITLQYIAPLGADPRLYGWWGDMDFAPHLLSTLAARRQGDIHVTLHPAVNVGDFTSRKALAKVLEAQVRSGLRSDGSA